MLRRNLAANALTNVTIIEAAVSNAPGEVRFAVADDLAMESLPDIDRADQRVQRWVDVPETTLDDTARARGIRAVDLVKLDIKGAEKLALEGARGMLSGPKAPSITLFEAFETNTRARGYDVRALLYLLRGHGYSIHYVDEERRLRPVESLNESDVGTTVYNFVAQREVSPSV